MALTYPETTTTHPAVRPFRIDVPEEELLDLHHHMWQHPRKCGNTSKKLSRSTPKSAP